MKTRDDLQLPTSWRSCTNVKTRPERHLAGRLSPSVKHIDLNLNVAADFFPIISTISAEGAVIVNAARGF